MSDPATRVERLQADGRRRIDSAMTDLIRYPRDSPLVVEGYAEEAGGNIRTCSRWTARSWCGSICITRFRRQTTLTDIMPVGAVGAIPAETVAGREWPWRCSSATMS